MLVPDSPDPAAAFAALAEPTRRRLYDYVASRHTAVGRDEAAKAAGIGRSLVAFHLDRLVAAGLLEVEYRRLRPRQGPGAGRPAKLYRRSSTPLDASLPEHRYALAADLFAAGIDSALPSSLEGVLAAARAHGRAVGAAATEETEGGVAEYPGAPAAEAGDAGDGAAAARLLDVLQTAGFEPERDEASGEIRLRNCPFRALAQAHRGTTCAMNMALLEGVADGLGLERLRPLPVRDDGYCCVSFAWTGPGPTFP